MKQLSILLVRPDTPKQSINLQSFMICEPLELEYVAAALTSKGVQVDLVDMLIEKKPLMTFLKKKHYDMVCFTAYITTVGSVKKYAQIVKKYNPDTRTAVGGVHAEVVPEDFVDENIDFILRANGVKTLLEIVDHGLSVTEKKQIPGIYIAGTDKPEVINDIPFRPDRKITQKYRSHYNYIYHNNCATIKTSFGCPYKCKFCFCTQICEYSARKLTDVLDELEEIEENNVFIVDDNFLVSRERITEFCKGLDERNIKKHYIAFGRADFIEQNEDIIIMLHNHGFEAFFVGIESFKKDELNGYHKQASVEQNIRAVKILERNGLQCYSGLIVGEDWKKADFDNLINYLNSFEHPMVNIQPVTPMPGTPLFEEYPDKITVKRDDYACWDMAHVVFVPKYMSKRRYYYHILRAYLKTSASRKQRIFIRQKYGNEIYVRVRNGAIRIALQYIKLMIFPK